VNTSDVFEGEILAHEYVPNVKLRGQFKKTFQKDDILFSEIRPANKRYAYVTLDDTRAYIASTKLMVLRANREKIIPRYLYSFLKSEQRLAELQHLAETRSGTFPQITFDAELAPLKIILPAYDTQKKIVDIISVFDDKIALNRKINKNLEKQAQTIFNAWFVDLLPFNRKIPSDWKILKFADIAELSAGGDKPAIVSETKSKECPYPIYSNGIAFNGLYGYTNIPRVKAESVTISARGTIGFVCLRNIPYVPIVRLITAIPKEHLVSAKYLYFWLKHIPIAGTGTTQQQLTIPAFKNTEILVPPIDIIIEFTDKVSHLFNLRYLYETEIETLTSLRDTLLPRLMSGELDVSNIEL